jgi:hypothetical protein
MTRRVRRTFELTCVTTLVDDSDEKEQSARREAVVDHLENAAGQSLVVQGEHAEHAEPEVADRRVSDQFLPILLHERDNGAVDHADHAQREDERREPSRGIRKHREAEPQETVDPHLEENTRKDDGARRRRPDVRVRKPRVEREHRHLDGKAEEKRQPDPRLQRHPVGPRAHRLKHPDVEVPLPVARRGERRER